MLHFQNKDNVIRTEEIKCQHDIQKFTDYREDEYIDDVEDFVEEEDFGDLTKVDYRNRNDPSSFYKYANKIFTDAMNEDFSDLINCECFLSTQKEITPNVRETSIKWLYQVAITRLRCNSDVIFSAIFYLDIIFCSRSVLKSNLQTIVVTCLWTAMKFYGFDYMTLEEYLNEISFSIPCDVIMKTEIDLIFILEMRLKYPTSNMILRRFYDVLSPGNQTIIECSNFFCQIGLLMFESLDFSSSEIASSAIYSSFIGLGLEFPMNTFQKYTNVSPKRITEISELIDQKAKNILKDHKHILYELFVNNQNLTKGVTKLNFFIK